MSQFSFNSRAKIINKFIMIYDIYKPLASLIDLI